MGLLVRSWNIFHGNTLPPERRARLAAAVRLATEDEPDVVCLQEVPVWALPSLGSWSGMQAFGAVAAPPRVGPLGVPAPVGHALTRLHEGFLRSAFSGQANAILVRRGLRAAAGPTIVLNASSFRRAQARWLLLPPVARLAWAKERRVCHAVRLETPQLGPVLVANLHATAYRPDRRLAEAELVRAAAWADALVPPQETLVLAGDFNVRAETSCALRELTGPEWGLSAPGPGIDHVLVRGASVGSLVRWPDLRRRIEGRLLSDHAPVEVTVG